jgi:pimeloyl-ACP methyl ester carboxylesterase
MEITLDDHQAYAYTAGGAIDPGRDTVVFVHGAGLDHTVWTLPARYFARHDRNVVAVDLPAHGRSAGPLRATIEAMADWVVAFSEALGVERAALVGHSMGSLVAYAAAARHPDRARALVLLGSALPMAVSPALLDNAREDRHAAIDMLTIWGHSSRARLGGSETPGMWMTGGTLRLFERAGPGVIYNDLNACNEYTDALELAPGIRCPTLLVLGERDIMTPPFKATEIARHISDSRIVTLPGSGHSMLSEQPDAVLDALITIV